MKPSKCLFNVFLISSILFFVGCGSSCRNAVVKAPPLPLPVSMVELGDVFFAFDSTVLEMTSQSQLDENVEWMMANSNATIIIEGHCDERGTYEYNIALGEKRAENVKNYMVDAGVDPLRMQVVSYGEERPFDPGHDEASWEKNRRVHFVVQ
ncbi:peptidoglycan-associated lipoprotein Pal [Prosthecochloris sp.]|uniref:peptidoglycan-associated lipoprotein Pal n=1 Tax=Prosthecochloris sp. TaxID=290513 RepID=UPI0025EC95A7|nr:peptidoglycan-associated lipoprotein Pal [Prosthecochloris sp.]